MARNSVSSIVSELCNTHISAPTSPTASQATSPMQNGSVVSPKSFRGHSPPSASTASSPGSSRPPSPLLQPLQPPVCANSHGLPTRPPFGFNALSGASMSFTAIGKVANSTANSASVPKRQDKSDADDDASSQTNSTMSTDMKRAHPARRTSSAAMQPFITKFDPYEPTEYIVDAKSGTRSPAPLEKVAIIGSGSWGTALARVAAVNVAQQDGFHPEVLMWVRDPDECARVNETHENARYLPGVDLPSNLVAVSSLADVVRPATLILFCVPHQFLPNVLAELAPGTVQPNARAISAIKGVDVHIREEEGTADIYTFPAVIEKALGIPCSALGGANIALDVGRGQFCETTIGVPSPQDAALWHAVFDSPSFRVHPTSDVSGVSLSGALKNVVALAAGFVDGMGLGGNTKAAILRIGLLEMSTFTCEFFTSASPLTFSHHSAGMADLITTSFGGRNRRCAEAFVRAGGSKKKKTFDELEKELLHGQKLQGTVTAREVFMFLHARGRLEGYPLFEKVYRISFEDMDPMRLFDDL